MIVHYMNATVLSLDEIYDEMDWECIDSLDAATTNKLCLPVE